MRTILAAISCVYLLPSPICSDPSAPGCCALVPTPTWGFQPDNLHIAFQCSDKDNACVLATLNNYINADQLCSSNSTADFVDFGEVFDNCQLYFVKYLLHLHSHFFVYSKAIVYCPRRLCICQWLSVCDARLHVFSLRSAKVSCVMVEISLLPRIV